MGMEVVGRLPLPAPLLQVSGRSHLPRAPRLPGMASQHLLCHRGGDPASERTRPGHLLRETAG